MRLIWGQCRLRVETFASVAVMGICGLISAVSGRDQPTVGLLNVGEETIKGSEVIKAGC